MKEYGYNEEGIIKNENISSDEEVDEES